MSVRAKSIVCILSIACGFSIPLYAKEQEFYFCGANVEEQKKYYVTGLFEGKLQIVTTQNLRSHLVEKLKLDSVSVVCFSYGSEAKPINKQVADKLRNLEIRKNQSSSEVELLKWTPD